MFQMVVRYCCTYDINSRYSGRVAGIPYFDNNKPASWEASCTVKRKFMREQSNHQQQASWKRQVLRCGGVRDTVKTQIL